MSRPAGPELPFNSCATVQYLRYTAIVVLQGNSAIVVLQCYSCATVPLCRNVQNGTGNTVNTGYTQLCAQASCLDLFHAMKLSFLI